MLLDVQRITEESTEVERSILDGEGEDEEDAVVLLLGEGCQASAVTEVSWPTSRASSSTRNRRGLRDKNQHDGPA